MADPVRKWRIRKWVWLLAALISLVLVLGRVSILSSSGPFGPNGPSGTDVAIYVSLAAFVISLLNFVLAWRKDARDREAAALSIEKTRLEIAKMRRDAEKG